MKSQALIFANVVVFLAPILVFATVAFAIAGMGGAFDRYDGTWIGTVIESSSSVVTTLWIVAALLNLVLAFLCVWKRTKPSVFLVVGSFMNLAAFLLLGMCTSNAVSRFVDAFVDVLFG